jgi:hypothetical protein
MADGPVDHLPKGLDAYAGYVNRSGIGETYLEVVLAFPDAIHFSITTNSSPAQCADVERGAMSDWTGYDWGYCAVSNVNELVARFGRPKKLWTAHYSPTYGPHFCSPACWPGLVTTADGTQWTDHGGVWDESLLLDDFFDLAPQPGEATNVTSWMTTSGADQVVHVAGTVGGVAYHWWQRVGGNPPGSPNWYHEVLPTP